MNKGNEGKIKCRTYIVVPPYHPSAKVSDQIAREWRDKKSVHLNKCSKIISPDVSSALFSLLNMSHSQRIVPKDVRDPHIDRIVDATKADSIVFLTSKRYKQSIHIDTQIYRLIPYNAVRLRKLTKTYKSKVPAIKYIKEKRSIGNFIVNRLPNSFTFNTIEKTGDGTIESDNYRVGRTKTYSFFPQVLSLLGMTSVTHPYGYSLFDVEFSSFFSLSLDGFDMKLTMVPRDDAKDEFVKEEIEYRFSHYSMTPFYNGQMSVFSPLGTTVMSLGFGPTFYSHFDDEIGRKLGVTTAVALSVGQRAFVTERIYFQMSYSFVGLTEPVVKREEFDFSTLPYLFFGFGYYFPEYRAYLFK